MWAASLKRECVTGQMHCGACVARPKCIDTNSFLDKDAVECGVFRRAEIFEIQQNIVVHFLRCLNADSGKVARCDQQLIPQMAQKHLAIANMAIQIIMGSRVNKGEGRNNS